MDKDYYNKNHDYFKEYNNKIIVDKSLEKYIQDYTYKNEWKIKEKSEQFSLSDMIRIYGLTVVLRALLEKYPIEEILEILDIKDVQQFLRKKKLEQLKIKNNV